MCLSLKLKAHVYKNVINSWGYGCRSSGICAQILCCLCHWWRAIHLFQGLTNNKMAKILLIIWYNEIEPTVWHTMKTLFSVKSCELLGGSYAFHLFQVPGPCSWLGRSTALRIPPQKWLLSLCLLSEREQACFLWLLPPEC